MHPKCAFSIGIKKERRLLKVFTLFIGRKILIHLTYTYIALITKHS